MPGSGMRLYVQRLPRNAGEVVSDVCDIPAIFVRKTPDANGTLSSRKLKKADFGHALMFGRLPGKTVIRNRTIARKAGIVPVSENVTHGMRLP